MFYLDLVFYVSYSAPECVIITSDGEFDCTFVFFFYISLKDFVLLFLTIKQDSFSYLNVAKCSRITLCMYKLFLIFCLKFAKGKKCIHTVAFPHNLFPPLPLPLLNHPTPTLLPVAAPGRKYLQVLWSALIWQWLVGN